MSSQVVAQLPHDARRVIVRGTTGSGKSTAARRIARSIGARHVELDAIFHQAGWTELEDDEFRGRIQAFADDESWVVCGNYRQVASILLERVDTLVLFDLPRRVVMARVIRRTIRRVVTGEELWNTNKEPWRNLFSLDPDTSIIAWAWTTHADHHDEILRLVAEPPRASLRLVHLRTVDDERFLYAGLVGAP